MKRVLIILVAAVAYGAWAYVYKLDAEAFSAARKMVIFE
jgi:hypothetical protein